MGFLAECFADLGQALMTEFHRPTSDWIPVSERLPDPYPQRIAVLLRTGKIVATHLKHDRIHGPFWSGIKDWFQVTHWMPLAEQGD